MFASYDMNPIALRQMQKERLHTDCERVDRGSRWAHRAGGVVVALVIVAVVLL